MSKTQAQYVRDFFDKAEREGQAVLFLGENDDYIEFTSAFQAEAIRRNATYNHVHFIASSTKDEIRVVCQRKNDQPVQRLPQPALDAVLDPPPVPPCRQLDLPFPNEE